MYYKITDGIQDLGTYIHQDVELTSGNSCEMFRADLGNQMGRIKDVQQQMAQCMGNIFSAVDTRLVQNDQRNNAQEVLLGELCATLKNLTVKLEQNTQENHQLNQKFNAIQQRMEGMSKEVKVEVGKSIDSVANHFEARLAEESKAQAMISRELSA